MSVNSKMTAIADEIRTLSGATGTMGLDAMASNVDAANTEIANQTSLISQITSALEGKAGGSGGAAVETCTFSITAPSSLTITHVWATTLDDDGKICYKTYTVGASTFTGNCLCNSHITVGASNVIGGTAYPYVTTANAVLLWSDAPAVFAITATAEESATILIKEVEGTAEPD